MILKRRFLWLFCCIVSLWIIYYVILQYLWSTHSVTTGVKWLLFSGMPSFVLHLAMIAIIIAAFLESTKRLKRLMISAVLGYGIGFVFAVIFNADLPPPGFAPPDSPSMTNNAWFIWLIAFLAFVLIPIVLEIGLRYRKRNLNKREELP